MLLFCFFFISIDFSRRKVTETRLKNQKQQEQLLRWNILFQEKENNTLKMGKLFT
jgi:hypothetical protein